MSKVERSVSQGPNYRRREVAELARWVAAGDSGCLLGPGGAGKSNLLAALEARPERLATGLPEGWPLAVIRVDLNDLPADDLATFYRLLLRALRDAASQLPALVGAAARAAFDAQLSQTDPFVVQTALLDLLAECRRAAVSLVLILDRFDSFLELAPTRLLDSLRALRDRHKERLVLLVGLRQPFAYQQDAARLGELYEVLDRRQLWLGPLVREDAEQLLAEEWPSGRPGDAAAAGGAATAGGVAAVVGAVRQEAILAATGGYPALLKAACSQMGELEGSSVPATEDDLTARLLSQQSVAFRLLEIWSGLSQAEQAALLEVGRLDQRSRGLSGASAGVAVQERLVAAAWDRFSQGHGPALVTLSAKGLLRADPGGSWQIPIGLLAAWLAGDSAAAGGRGRIWQDAGTQELFQGQRPLTDLANLERRMLLALLARPRVRVAKSVLIEQVWPEDAVRAGVMDDALYQVVKELRRKIEPDPAGPVYLLTFRGQPEGGYQFFPEGRPAG